MTTALAKQFIHCIMRDTYLKDISLKERNDLHWLLDHDGESAYPYNALDLHSSARYTIVIFFISCLKDVITAEVVVVENII